jgi:hypothetical protein
MTNAPIRPPGSPTPEEPLALSAPLALAWSRTLCRYVDASGESCAAFHGIWQYLRLLELNTGPRDHAIFYLEALRPLIRRGARRVLISGSADYAMPAVVLWAFAAEAVEPDLTVVDACETPLRISAWYADRYGHRLATVVADILDYRPQRRFDIVCTDSFLGLFATEGRRRLIGSWREMLAPGGALVSVNRIRPGAGELVGFAPEQARIFRERVIGKAVETHLPGVSADELAALVDGYLRHRVVFPLRSVDELTSLLEAGGFRLQSLAADPIGGGAAVAPSGPTMRDGATYARFVALRREGGRP